MMTQMSQQGRSSLFECTLYRSALVTNGCEEPITSYSKKLISISLLVSHD